MEKIDKKYGECELLSSNEVNGKIIVLVMSMHLCRLHDLSQIVFSEENIPTKDSVLLIVPRPKEARGNVQQFRRHIRLTRCANKRVCPLTALKWLYLHWLALGVPYGPLLRSTTGEELVKGPKFDLRKPRKMATDLMRACGIELPYTLHSVRCAGASALLQAGWSMEMVTKWGHWKNGKALTLHYDRSSSQVAVSGTVLKAFIKSAEIERQPDYVV